MKRRFSFIALTVVVACVSLMPSAFAAPGDIMKATGTGDARALDLDVLGLVRLTIAAADGKFELSTKDAGTATTSGRAVGICNLITGGSDPLACSQGNVASSSAPPDSKAGPNCTIPPINAIVASVEAACGRSESKVAGSAPTGAHTASLGAVNVGLTPELKALLTSLVGTVENTTDGVQQTVGGLTATVTQLLGTATGVAVPNPTDVTNPIVDQVQAQLKAIIDQLTTLASIKVLPAEVHVSSPEKMKAKVEATSNVVDISLLGGLIQVQVTPSLANATYDGNAGKANCHAEAAVARVKVKNILGGGELVNLAPGQNIASLLPLGNDLVGLKVASATPDSVGDTCRAEARGLELNLLKIVNGGIALRVASTNAQIAGAVTPLTLAAGPVCPDPKGCLPMTGGPTYLYMTAALLMAAAALGSFKVYRKLSATA